MKTKPIFYDVLIIGGGLAGLSAAIHLSKLNYHVVVIEKNDFPKHKVCGEYISNEVLPYLDFLEINVFELGAQKINKFELTTPNNKKITSNLPLGGFGISRYTLDHAMCNRARQNGAVIVKDSVTDVQFLNEEFRVQTKNNSEFKAKIVIGAYGKRSNMDVNLKRAFIKKKSPFLAVKTHVKGDFPNDVVALHNFKGGYCGVSKVENDSINLCYIVEFETFKKYRDIDEFQQKVVFKNTCLKSIFENSQPIFEQPLTISQISFSNKHPVENHILMCGDTAGMIHPLCGNGMSMAIKSSQMASQLIIKYLEGEIASRTLLENQYRTQWNQEFKTRLKIGHLVASIFSKNYMSELLIYPLNWFPDLLPLIIKQTHGKPMTLLR